MMVAIRLSNAMRFTSVSMIVLLCCLLQAASMERLSINQLRDLLTSTHGEHQQNKLARRLGLLVPAERISDAQLAELARGVNSRLRAALYNLADRSILLNPPSSAIVLEGPPPVPEQRAILERTAGFIAQTYRALPDFICTETVYRFSRDSKKPDTWTGLEREDVLRGELAVQGGKESTTFQFRNGVPIRDGDRFEGMSDGGNFSVALPFIFRDHSSFQWLRWERLDGERVAVFSYSTPQDSSHYVLGYSAGAAPLSVTASYSGLIFVRPDDGTVLRFTRKTGPLPMSFPIRLVEVAVSYKVFLIDSYKYLLPAKCVSLASSLVIDQPSSDVAAATFVSSLNRYVFSAYRKFTADSVISFGPPIR
jgi:hypothetical protein